MFNNIFRTEEHTLKKRYFYKLSSNLWGLLAGLVTMVIIPRALGPVAYGDFNFLTNVFNQVVGFLDMGTSTGFYAKLSRRQKEPKLVWFYLNFVGIVVIIIGLFMGITYFTKLYKILWPGQLIFFVGLAAGWGILTWVSQIFSQMADAYGLTVPAEIGKVMQRALTVILVFSLFMLGGLNLANYFYLQFLLLAVLIGIFGLIIYIKQPHFLVNRGLDALTTRKYIKEFYEYCHPLFLYALVGMLVGIMDRWILQFFGGSIQQGFFGLSYNLGVFCFLFTGAMTPLLMREFSIAYGKSDLPKMAVMFRRYIPVLYSIAAYLACFVAVQAVKVVQVFGGKNYAAAVVPVAIMAFYPIHQTYGQLSGSVFLATGQTVLYRNIGIIFMVLGLPLTYFLIAPAALGGIGAGALGLALKMVILQFVAVNTQLYFNAKLLKLSFLKYLGHQLLSLLFFLVLAGLAALGIDQFKLNPVSSLIISGILYSGSAILIIYLFPQIVGLKRDDFSFVMKYLAGDKI